jgi:hypothetical protein
VSAVRLFFTFAKSSAKTAFFSRFTNSSNSRAEYSKQKQKQFFVPQWPAIQLFPEAKTKGLLQEQLFSFFFSSPPHLSKAQCLGEKTSSIHIKTVVISSTLLSFWLLEHANKSTPQKSSAHQQRKETHLIKPSKQTEAERSTAFPFASQRALQC